MDNFEKMTKNNVRQYMRLQKYLIELHQTGKVCVFTELVGHVDWVDICITPSHEDYHTKLYATEQRLSNLSKRVVDGIIKDIEKMLAEIEATKERLAREKEREEREVYEKLKAKYGATK